MLKHQLKAVGAEPVECVTLDVSDSPMHHTHTHTHRWFRSSITHLVTRQVAREKMQEAVQRLMEGDELAEKEIEKWDQAIKMNPEYAKEQEVKLTQCHPSIYPHIIP